MFTSRALAHFVFPLLEPLPIAPSLANSIMRDGSRRVAVSPHRGGRFIILPETSDLQVPLYDENEQYLTVSNIIIIKNE